MAETLDGAQVTDPCGPAWSNGAINTNGHGRAKVVVRLSPGPSPGFAVVCEADGRVGASEVQQFVELSRVVAQSFGPG